MVIEKLGAAPHCIYRFPRDAAAAAAFAIEQSVLEAVGTTNIPIPRYIHTDADNRYGYYHRLKGQPLTVELKELLHQFCS